MINLITHIITWLNIPVNAIAKFLLTPVGYLPGWLSNTIISAITGVILLIIFKHTSNQSAIGKIRDDIKAHMLALKLFRDSFITTIQAQGQVFRGAILLLLQSIRPMLVMIIPVSLILIQLSLWYQYRPLKVGEETTITMKLKSNTENPWPTVNIISSPAAQITMGPIRVFSKRQIYWKIKARQKGYHQITFNINQQQIDKELVIGDGFMRLSSKRPSWQLTDVLKHPKEKPFTPESLVQSISIDYPTRSSLTSGTNSWLIYFFIASIVSALIFKPFFKVKI